MNDDVTIREMMDRIERLAFQAGINVGARPPDKTKEAPKAVKMLVEYHTTMLVGIADELVFYQLADTRLTYGDIRKAVEWLRENVV